MKNFLRAVASLLIVVLALSAQADWTKLNQQIQKSKSSDDAIARIQESEEISDADLSDLVDVYNSSESKADKDAAFESIKQFVSSSAFSEHFEAPKSSDAVAKEIKKDPIYKAEKEVISSNWIQKLLDRLKKAFESDSKEPEKPSSPPPAWIFDLIRGLFLLFCIAIIGLIVFLLTKIPWSWSKAGRSKKAKRGGMLEEGEELLSEDEYLLEADRLIAEGRYREACRALYLASLLRIDKSRIARFEPTQTNWEHLRRIENSSIRPERLEFREVTKAFDLAWYGYRAKSVGDVLIFRETYLMIKSLTEVIS